MSLHSVRITPVNVYEQMAQGSEERRAILESAIRSPVGYKFRLFQEVIDDPARLVTAYMDITQGTAEGVNQFTKDRLNISISLANSGEKIVAEGIENFNDRVIEVLSSISIQTLDKMRTAYRMAYKIVSRENGSRNIPAWKIQVLEQLNESGTILARSWSKEAEALALCRTYQQVIDNVINGCMIPRIQEWHEEGKDIEFQEMKLSYVKTVFLTATLQMHILLD